MMTLNAIHAYVLINTVVFLLVSPALALQPQQEQAVVVGHLTHREGNVLRYDHDNENWAQLVKDSPVGVSDSLFSETNAKAEIIIPNNTWFRMGSDTRIQIVSLENDRTEMEIDSGMGRFYNKSTSATIKVNTPFGAVLGPPLTAFDVYLDKDSVQVTAVAGTVNFNHITDKSSHEIRAGSSSLHADFQNITAEKGLVDEDFNAWNAKRDDLWNDRLEAPTDSQSYLPSNLSYASYSLHENGVWETIHYQGRNCNFWRPIHVSAYWSPFTVGSWRVWYGDHCWIPYEPFGYLTHHYGNWVYIDSRNRWYWAPPACHNRISTTAVFSIPFAWYPGRVSWIHSYDCVGWIPLAPFEPYYCYRSWGPHTYVVGRDRLRRVTVDLDHCRYKKHAVIVKKHDFYTAINYNKIRMKNIGKTDLDRYQRVPFMSDKDMRSYRNVNQSFTPMARRAHQKLTVPVKETMERKKPKDALLTRRITPGSQKRVSIGNSVTPTKKPLHKTLRTLDTSVAPRDKYEGGGFLVSTTAKLSKRAKDLEPARTKLWQRSQPQAIVPKPLNKPQKVLPQIKQQRPTRAPASDLGSLKAVTQTDVQRPTRIMKIQPQPERRMLNSRAQGLPPQPKVIHRGQGETIRSNNFSRLRSP